jgi:hypothetical protein
MHLCTVVVDQGVLLFACTGASIWEANGGAGKLSHIRMTSYVEVLLRKLGTS